MGLPQTASDGEGRAPRASPDRRIEAAPVRVAVAGSLAIGLAGVYALATADDQESVVDPHRSYSEFTRRVAARRQEASGGGPG